MTPRFLTVPEVAAALRVCRMTVYRLVDDGELASTRVGRSIRIHADSFHDYLNRNTSPAFMVRRPLRSTG